MSTNNATTASSSNTNTSGSPAPITQPPQPPQQPIIAPPNTAIVQTQQPSPPQQQNTQNTQNTSQQQQQQPQRVLRSSTTPTPTVVATPPTPPAPTGGTYTPVLHTTQTPPAPLGDIAKEMHNIPLNQQRLQAETLFTILTAQTPNLADLNITPSLASIIVAVPETCSVKVLYGLAFGSSPAGSSSPLDGKILSLTGEGGPTMGLPEVLALDATELIPMRDCLACTDTLFKTTLTAAGPNFGKFLVNPLHSDCTEEVPGFAVLPNYFLYDGLTKDLNAAEVYERLLQSTHTAPWLDSAKAFLRSVVIGNLRKNDPKPYVPRDLWHSMAPLEAKIWKKTQCEHLLPVLFPTIPILPTIHPPPHLQVPPGIAPHVSAPAPAPPNTAPGLSIPQTQQHLMDQFFKSMLESWQRTTKVVAGTTGTEEKKEDISELSTKVSDMETQLMKTLCGQNPISDDIVLPDWYRKMFRKHQTKQDRDMIVAAALGAGRRFEDAHVPCYPELKTMIQNRDWAGSEAGSRPTLTYACKGVTIFAMLDLTDDEIAQMQHEEDIMTAASFVSPSDVRSAKKKLVPTVPTDRMKWKEGILKYTNFLRNIFTASSPLYSKMLKIAGTISGYQRCTLESIPLHALAAIYWIIHLQSRHYAQGRMIPDSPGEVLPEFNYMYNMLASGQIHMISYAALPAKLVPTTNPLKRKQEEEGSPAFTDERLAKLLKLEKDLEAKLKKTGEGSNKVREPWSDKLKAKLLPALKTASFPSLKRICQFCNISNQADIIPNIGRRQCRNFLALGRCRFNDKCNLEHKTATDEQATHIIQKLEQFIQQPDQLPGM